jgi:hypothetical protein
MKALNINLKRKLLRIVAIALIVLAIIILAACSTPILKETGEASPLSKGINHPLNQY